MTPLPSDDIPEALRDSTAVRSPALSSQGKFPILWIIMIGAGAIALGAATALLWNPMSAEVATQTSAVSTNPNGLESDSSQDGQTQGENSLVEGAVNDDDGALLGHKPYEEVDEELLVPVVGDSSVRLRAAAAESFAEMVTTAVA